MASKIHIINLYFYQYWSSVVVVEGVVSDIWDCPYPDPGTKPASGEWCPGAGGWEPAPEEAYPGG